MSSPTAAPVTPFDSRPAARACLRLRAKDGVVVAVAENPSLLSPWRGPGMGLGSVDSARGNGLGHSSIAITGDIYGHTSDDAARTAVERLSRALGL